jgi:hypothetical protein
MAKPLLPLCSIPTIADKEGQGSNTFHWLPFYGYWSASGQVLAFPTMEVRQDNTMRMGGVGMPNTYQKDCCTCAAGYDDPFFDIYRPVPRN